MKGIIILEFPCGYKIDMRMSTLVSLGGGELSTDDLPICPLHGKGCKRA